jgi:hypothetical protein
MAQSFYLQSDFEDEDFVPTLPDKWLTPVKLSQPQQRDRGQRSQNGALPTDNPHLLAPDDGALQTLREQLPTAVPGASQRAARASPQRAPLSPQRAPPSPLDLFPNDKTKPEANLPLQFVATHSDLTGLPYGTNTMDSPSSGLTVRPWLEPSLSLKDKPMSTATF